MPSSVDEEGLRCSQACAWLAGSHAAHVEPATSTIPIVLRVSAHPVGDSWVVREIFEPSFRVLSRLSRGRIAVQASWGESAHPAREGFAALTDGRTDFAPCYTSWEAEAHPLSQLVALPSLFPTPEVATAVLERLYDRYLKPEFERPGVCMGRLKATGAYHLFSRRKLRSLRDLRGLTVATNTGIDARIAAALGATPISLSSVELLPAYLAGRVDAVSLADGSAQVFGVGQRSICRLEIGVSMMNMEFGLATAFFAQLDDDLRAVFNDWLRAQAQAETQYFYGYGGALARQAFADAGCEFVALPTDDCVELDRRMAALTREITAALDARGLPASAFVEAAQAESARLAEATANDLMLAAVREPLWLLPGRRPGSAPLR